jgi:hypothetical protein
LALNTPMKTLRNTLLLATVFYLAMCSPLEQPRKSLSRLHKRACEVRMFAQKNGYSTRYCFMLDMRVHSGQKRFFVYDLSRDMVVFSGLVAHGSCEQAPAKKVSFSNNPGSGCTSIGLYKVGCAYNGQYGRSYRLHGLESSNSNAFTRAVVLHAYSCVPEQECYPKPICNSLGCPMVAPAFFKKLSAIIDKSKKPILLWIYDKPGPLPSAVERVV